MEIKIKKRNVMLSAVEASRQKQSMNMYKFKNILSFLIAVVITSTTLAQENRKTKDTINTEVVNVVKPYTPKISDAFKVKEIPSLDDETTTTKKAIIKFFKLLFSGSLKSGFMLISAFVIPNLIAPA